MKGKQTIFLTGLSGLLGTNLVHRLLDEGFYIRGLVRRRSSFKGKTHPNLSIIEGDLFSDFSGALVNVDIVIHVAAETRQNLLTYSEYKKINFDATVQLYKETVNADVEKFIFVSTANTIGYGSKLEPGNETIPMKYPFFKSFYGRSKREAEDFLLSVQDETEVLIINPTFMIGAYDSKPSSGKIILMGLNKPIIFYPSGGKNFVHVEDVVQAILNIMVMGKAGERYLIAGENLTFREFFSKLIGLTGQRTVLVPLPSLALLSLGYLGDLIRSLGIKSSISSINFKSLLISNFYSNKKSISELGIRYRSIDSAISDAVDYFEGEKIE